MRTTHTLMALLLLVLGVTIGYLYATGLVYDPVLRATEQQVDYCAARGASVVFLPAETGLKPVCASSLFESH